MQRQRDLVGWKVAGASDDVLRLVATPTGLTAHGVVRHLTNVERSWIREIFAGQEGRFLFRGELCWFDSDSWLRS